MHYFKYEAICHLENDMTVCYREFIDITLVLTSIPSVNCFSCMLHASAKTESSDSDISPLVIHLHLPGLTLTFNYIILVHPFLLQCT